MNPVKFFFVFFVLFVTLVDCSTVKDVSDDDDDGSNVIVVVPTAALKIIQTVVGVLTDVGIKGINGLSANVGKIEKQAHELEQKLVDRLWEFAEKRLDDVAADANDFTKMAIECLKDEVGDLKGMVYNFSSQSVSCEIEKTVTTLNSYIPVLTDIKSTNDKMKDFIERLGSCGNDETAIPCLDEVSDEMEKELTELVDTVKDDLEDAAALQENYERFAALCHQDATSRLEENSKDIATIVSKCIEDHYLNSTSV